LLGKILIRDSGLVFRPPLEDASIRMTGSLGGCAFATGISCPSDVDMGATVYLGIWMADLRDLPKLAGIVWR